MVFKKAASELPSSRVPPGSRIRHPVRGTHSPWLRDCADMDQPQLKMLSSQNSEVETVELAWPWSASQKSSCCWTQSAPTPTHPGSRPPKPAMVYRTLCFSSYSSYSWVSFQMLPSAGTIHHIAPSSCARPSMPQGDQGPPSFESGAPAIRKACAWDI